MNAVPADFQPPLCSAKKSAVIQKAAFLRPVPVFAENVPPAVCRFFDCKINFLNFYV
jgi:hypothetical protein